MLRGTFRQWNLEIKRTHVEQVVFGCLPAFQILLCLSYYKPTTAVLLQLWSAARYRAEKDWCPDRDLSPQILVLYPTFRMAYNT